MQNFHDDGFVFEKYLLSVSYQLSLLDLLKLLENEKKVIRGDHFPKIHCVQKTCKLADIKLDPGPFCVQSMFRAVIRSCKSFRFSRFCISPFQEWSRVRVSIVWDGD